MKTKTLLILIVAISILVTGCRHYRCAGHSDRLDSQEHLRHHVNHIAADLNLTARQRASLEQLLATADGFRTTAQARERMRGLFASELAKPALDASALHTELNREIELIRTAGSNFVNMAVVLHGSLDATQRAELSQKLNSAPQMTRNGRRQ